MPIQGYYAFLLIFYPGTFFSKKIYLELTLQDNMEHHARTHAHILRTHPKTDHLKVKSGWEWVGWEWVGLFKKKNLPRLPKSF